jgi:hypothetical protein
MAYEELFTDLLKAEREEDVTDALTVFGLEKFTDSNWLPYGGIENDYWIPSLHPRPHLAHRPRQTSLPAPLQQSLRLLLQKPNAPQLNPNSYPLIC